MAEILDDGEFWLPPQFLTDDDDFDADNRAPNSKKKAEFGLFSDKGSFFSFDSPFGGYGSFGGSSDFSSPVESVVGSTETESDEEDTLVGKASFGLQSAKDRTLSSSPQSTLYRQGSSGGSPNGPCQVSSPPATWDLLFAAAGEVAKMKMNNDESNMVPPRKLSPIGVPVKELNAGAELSQQRLKFAQFQILKQQQMLKQGPGIWGGQAKGNGHFQPQQVVQNRARNNEFIGGGGRTVRHLGLSPSAWPPLQQNGSAMRAVFLGGPPAKRECAGTGVFLPRQKVGASESRKKPVCSTVLVPDRVVKALNLNLDAMGVNGPKTAEIAKASPQSSHSQRRSNNLRSPAVINPELRLPQEWTY